MHDACLIVRMHDDDGLASVAVIDLHYMNLDRRDLDETNLLQRIPLLFAPYYLQDGMNRHGVAISDMSVDGVRAPYDPGKPNILHATAMRLVLDEAKSVDEAVNMLTRYNIHFGATTCHFMIADASGKSAVVEFFDGKMELTDSREHWQVCTNLAKLSATAGTDDVMRVMQSVSKKDWTMWTSVYDLSARRLRFAYRGHFDQPYDDSLIIQK
jgi:choloylglycine hydrolase